VRLIDATADAAALVAQDDAGGVRTYTSSRWGNVLSTSVASARPIGLRDLRSAGVAQGFSPAAVIR